MARQTSHQSLVTEPNPDGKETGGGSLALATLLFVL